MGAVADHKGMSGDGSNHKPTLNSGAAQQENEPTLWNPIGILHDIMESNNIQK